MLWNAFLLDKRSIHIPHYESRLCSIPSLCAWKYCINLVSFLWFIITGNPWMPPPMAVRHWYRLLNIFRQLLLTLQHRWCCLNLYQFQASWALSNWRKMIFSNKSNFPLNVVDHLPDRKANGPILHLLLSGTQPLHLEWHSGELSKRTVDNLYSSFKVI